MTLKVKSYEVCVNGSSVPVGSAARSGWYCESTTPVSTMFCEASVPPT